MPGNEQIGVRVPQCILLVRKQFQRQPRVQFRIVDLPAHERAILIVLDEAMIGIRRKRQGTQAQGVQHRHAEQLHPRRRCPEMFQIKLDQIVAGEAIATRRKVVDLLQCGGQTRGAQALFPERECRAGFLIDGGQRVYALAAFSNLQID